MVIAPHPDDESLGCGGTLFKHRSEGDDIHWCVVTDMQQSSNYTSEQKAQRAELVEKVSNHFDFSSERNLGFTPAGLDSTTTGALILGAGVGMTALAYSWMNYLGRLPRIPRVFNK